MLHSLIQLQIIGGTNAQSNPQDGMLRVLVPLLFWVIWKQQWGFRISHLSIPGIAAHDRCNIAFSLYLFLGFIWLYSQCLCRLYKLYYRFCFDFFSFLAYELHVFRMLSVILIINLLTLTLYTFLLGLCETRWFLIFKFIY